MAWDTSDRRQHLPLGWKALRLCVLERDAYRCQLVGPHCTGHATEVDHAGHRDDHHPDRLRAACHACHARRTAQQSSASRAARRRRAVEPPPGLRRSRHAR